jgi:hypothetical protein
MAAAPTTPAASRESRSNPTALDSHTKGGKPSAPEYRGGVNGEPGRAATTATTPAVASTTAVATRAERRPSITPRVYVAVRSDLSDRTGA